MKQVTSTTSRSNASERLTFEFDKQTAGKDAYNRIRDLVVTGVLQPGQNINEQDLVRHLGIGRTPVREAIQRLAHQHVVEVYPRRGLAVAKLSLEDVQAVFEARETIEEKIAELAAIRRTDDEARELMALGERIGGIVGDNDYTVFLQLDQQLHHFIAIAARNQFLAESVDHLLMLSEWVWHQYFRLRGSSPADFFTHEPIISAIIDRDASRAGLAMREHVQHSRDVVRSVV